MKLTKQQRNKQKVNISIQELEKIKRNATDNAIKITNLFPLWVLRTKFGFGEKRLRKFMAEYVDLLDSYNRDYISLQDIAQQLDKETGIRLDEENEK